MFVAQRFTPGEYPPVRPVLMPEPEFDFVLRDFAVQVALEVLHHARPIIGMQVFLKR